MVIENFPFSFKELQKELAKENYFIGDEACRKLVLYLSLGKPVGLRGEPGVGKSELADKIAKILGMKLIDIECHSQLEASDIGVAWNAFRQIVDAQTGQLETNAFSIEYLNRTPLIESLFADTPVVVRVDEVDKLNETTSNFFLRYLDKKELIVHDLAESNKVLKASVPIYVFLTSNDYRELDPAFMRRVAWIELTFPSEEQLSEIIERVVHVPHKSARRYAFIVTSLRELEIKKKPSIGETLDWVRGLQLLSNGQLTLESIQATLGLLLKFADDEKKGWEAIREWIS